MKGRAIVFLVILAMVFPLNCLAGEKKLVIKHNVPEVLMLYDLPFVMELEVTGLVCYVAVQVDGQPELRFYKEGDTPEIYSLPLNFDRSRENSMLVAASDPRGNITTMEINVTLEMDCPGCDLSCSEPDYCGYPFWNMWLDGANLSGADFRGNYLVETRFRGANLVGADFSSTGGYETFAHRMDFIGADLRFLNFEGTRVYGMDFREANLEGANLRDSEVVSCHWGNTICPDGTNSDAAGGTCLGHL
jgi:hypothetical protein